jgi:hypothetical protein
VMICARSCLIRSITAAPGVISAGFGHCRHGMGRSVHRAGLRRKRRIASVQ